jgi:NTE family protein
VVEPLRQVAAQTIDEPALVAGATTPRSAAERLVAALRKQLFGASTLQDLPDRPAFTLVATNMRTGAVWPFSKASMGKGRRAVNNPSLQLATAVAASAAVPPIFSPVRLRLDAEDLRPTAGESTKAARPAILLTDGSVSDRMALETAWEGHQTILVSDGGGETVSQSLPPTDWARQSMHVLGLIDGQLRSVRKRQILSSLRDGVRRGTYWGILSNIQAYRLSDALSCPFEKTVELARLPSRFARLPMRTQERLINWGYAVCDAALRRHCLADLPSDPEESKANASRGSKKNLASIAVREEMKQQSQEPKRTQRPRR